MNKKTEKIIDNIKFRIGLMLAVSCLGYVLSGMFTYSKPSFFISLFVGFMFAFPEVCVCIVIFGFAYIFFIEYIL